MNKMLKEGKQSAPYTVARTYSAQGKKVSVELKQSDGTVQREFLRDGMLFEWDSKTGISWGNATRDNSGEFSVAFLELNWVSAENFAGPQIIGGVKYFVYDSRKIAHLLPDFAAFALRSQWRSLSVFLQAGYKGDSRDASGTPAGLGEDLQEFFAHATLILRLSAATGSDSQPGCQSSSACAEPIALLPRQMPHRGPVPALRGHTIARNGAPLPPRKPSAENPADAALFRYWRRNRECPYPAAALG